jgi:release factor glutamine methyltransferase
VNIGELLTTVTKRLPGDTPELDSQVLLAHILDKSRSWVAAHPEAPLTQSQLASVEDAVSQLESGEPLPYVLGHREFFGLDFELSPDVLIPRPETELLVERAIKWLGASNLRRTVADVGTGSGCIAISIAKHISDAKIIATDLSLPALEVARRNACKHNVMKRIDFVQCDLLPPHPDSLPTDQHFDLICANLPYIPSQTLRELPIYGREPTLALNGGTDGLDILRRLLQIAPEWLAPNGMILLEIETSRGMSAVSLAYDAFDSAEIHLHKDLAGQDRLVEIML